MEGPGQSVEGRLHSHSIFPSPALGATTNLLPLHPPFWCDLSIDGHVHNLTVLSCLAIVIFTGLTSLCVQTAIMLTRSKHSAQIAERIIDIDQKALGKWQIWDGQ